MGTVAGGGFVSFQDLPRINEAFRTGRLSFSKVRPMNRVATPDNEDYLMIIAGHDTAAHVEPLVRGCRKVKRIEALNQPGHPGPK